MKALQLNHISSYTIMSSDFVIRDADYRILNTINWCPSREYKDWMFGTINLRNIIRQDTYA